LKGSVLLHTSVDNKDGGTEYALTKFAADTKLEGAGGRVDMLKGMVAVQRKLNSS